MEAGSLTIIQRFEEWLRGTGALDAQLTAAWLLLAGMAGLLVFLLWRKKSASRTRAA